MRRWSVVLAGVVALGAAACGKTPPAGQGGGASGGMPSDQEPPVALNGDSPIQYPPRLYDQKVEGDVVLRLFVDSLGGLRPESTRVAESSGYPALDSAALAGARKLRFAPARRHGLPIATAFLQPVEFRHPQATGAVAKGEPDTTRPQPAPVRAPAPSPPPVAAPAPAAPARAPRPDSAPLRRDTFPRAPDTTRTRTGPDSAPTKPDTNAAPR
jgi:TonB family protein